ncbi:MAG: hypothetical protein GF381_02410 [Candidatus Pacebacteria bacterium]|nr:hypothetical protein [Candidatus Paceibacterota bacterium]
MSLPEEHLSKPRSPGRRDFLRRMGLAVALVALTGCSPDIFSGSSDTESLRPTDEAESEFETWGDLQRFNHAIKTFKEIHTLTSAASVFRQGAQFDQHRVIPIDQLLPEGTDQINNFLSLLEIDTIPQTGLTHIPPEILTKARTKLALKAGSILNIIENTESINQPNERQLATNILNAISLIRILEVAFLFSVANDLPEALIYLEMSSNHIITTSDVQSAIAALLVRAQSYSQLTSNQQAAIAGFLNLTNLSQSEDGQQNQTYFDDPLTGAPQNSAENLHTAYTAPFERIAKYLSDDEFNLLAELNYLWISSREQDEIIAAAANPYNYVLYCWFTLWLANNNTDPRIGQFFGRVNINGHIIDTGNTRGWLIVDLVSAVEPNQLIDFYLLVNNYSYEQYLNDYPGTDLSKEAFREQIIPRMALNSLNRTSIRDIVETYLEVVYSVLNPGSVLDPLRNPTQRESVVRRALDMGLQPSEVHQAIDVLLESNNSDIALRAAQARAKQVMAGAYHVPHIERLKLQLRTEEVTLLPAMLFINADGTAELKSEGVRGRLNEVPGKIYILQTDGSLKQETRAVTLTSPDGRPTEIQETVFQTVNPTRVLPRPGFIGPGEKLVFVSDDQSVTRLLDVTGSTAVIRDFDDNIQETTLTTAGWTQQGNINTYLEELTWVVDSDSGQVRLAPILNVVPNTSDDASSSDSQPPSQRKIPLHGFLVENSPSPDKVKHTQSILPGSIWFNKGRYDLFYILTELARSNIIAIGENDSYRFSRMPPEDLARVLSQVLTDPSQLEHVFEVAISSLGGQQKLFESATILEQQEAASSQVPIYVARQSDNGLPALFTGTLENNPMVVDHLGINQLVPLFTTHGGFVRRGQTISINNESYYIIADFSDIGEVLDHQSGLIEQILQKLGRAFPAIFGGVSRGARSFLVVKEEDVEILGLNFFEVMTKVGGYEDVAIMIVAALALLGIGEVAAASSAVGATVTAITNAARQLGSLNLNAFLIFLTAQQRQREAR